MVLLKDWELIAGDAIDSFKIRAQNSLKNNFNQKKIDRHLNYIDEKIEEYTQVLDSEDIRKPKQLEVKQKLETQKQRKKKYKAIDKELQESGEPQISTTDQDARSVILYRNIVNVGYCVQAGCDEKHKLFVNNDTGTVNDTQSLSPMALGAKEFLGIKKMNTLTDNGYTTGVHIDTCIQNGITTYSFPKDHSSLHNGLFDMQIFEYNKKCDYYTCPSGEILSTNGKVYNNTKQYENFKSCTTCLLREKCTKAKKERLIKRSIYKEALEQNEKRVNENSGYYKLRQQVSEHQFGTLKRQWGFTFTLMKGKEKVLSEVNLMMTCYNLLRLVQILGIEKLKDRLRSLCFFISQLIQVIINNFKLFLRFNLLF